MEVFVVVIVMIQLSDLSTQQVLHFCFKAKKVKIQVLS